MMIPNYYGADSIELTGKQKVQSQGLDVLNQGLNRFFDWKMSGSNIQSSQGGGYYTPPPQQQPNYTPLIVGSIIMGTAIIGGIVWINTKGKKK